jgi:hypothetical protein
MRLTRSWSANGASATCILGYHRPYADIDHALMPKLADFVRALMTRSALKFLKSFLARKVQAAA